MKKDWFHKFMFGDKDEPPPNTRVCEHEGCTNAGLYPAPKSRENLQDRYYFCLDHVREYNRQWNYFDGYTAEEIYRQQSEDAGWDRPTWPAWQYNEDALRAAAEKMRGLWEDEPPRQSRNKERQKPLNGQVVTEDDARTVLGVEPFADEKDVKTKYRQLVKKYHPDINKDKNAEEQFKLISQAYNILKKIFKTGE